MEALIQAHKEEDRKKAKVGIIVWTIIMLMILIFPFMTIPNPPPGQEGIIVNLGMIDIGQGDENAPPAEATAAADTKPVEEPAEPEKTEPKEEVKPEPEPKKKEKTKKKEPKPTPTKVKDTKKVIVDNSEEIALQKAKEKAEKAAKAKRDQEARQEAAERQAEADKIAQAEAAEAKAKAAEAAKKAAALAAKQAAEAAKKAEADALRASLSQAAKGSGKGNTGTSGNQGDPGGDPSSDILEGISTGAGKVGGGISNRGGRGPKITDNSQETGIVVVKVCVDGSGNVISAQYTQQGSTASSSRLKQLAEANAKSWNFKAGELDKACGTITYDFKVK